MVIDTPAETDGFEQLYLAVRQHEARVYTDEEVANLPQIAAGHPHEKEWAIRQRSAKRLVNYVQTRKRPLRILEIGCGNGWLSAALARIPQTEVVGIDVNQVEIEQAKSVFNADNLQFMSIPFDADSFAGASFDMVIFAAVLPYFQLVDETIGTALNLLRPDGEVHIVDTHFYDEHSVDNAERRCREYYQAMGLSEMADHYYHHQLNVLSKFNHHLLIDPRSVMNRLLKKDPFYWVVIKPEVK